MGAPQTPEAATGTPTATVVEEPLRCDLLIFVATSSERNALKQAAKDRNLPFKRRRGRLVNYYDLGQVGDTRVMAVKTEMGPFSYRGSEALAIYAKTETSATALISLGMAFGVDRDKQKIGTLLVARILLPYDNREVRTVEGRMVFDYSNVAPHKAKPALTQMLEREAARAEWSGKVSFGAVLTGGARIRCSEYRNHLVSNLSNFGEMVVVGEMEGFGVLATSDPEDPNWVLVKGISDFADEDRDNEVKTGREIACRRAAEFVLNAISNANL